MATWRLDSDGRAWLLKLLLFERTSGHKGHFFSFGKVIKYPV